MDDKTKNLLANCLREDPNGYVIQAVAAEYLTLSELMDASEPELRLVKGIGILKAKQLKAILDFVRQAHAPDTDRRIIIRSPDDVFDLLRGDMEFAQVEKFFVIGLSTKNHVIFKELISTGSLNASIVTPRETFKPLIKRACNSCVLVHNHPSGDPTPSREDIELTRRLVEAGKLLEIQVLDHVIIGRGAYVSLNDKGIL